MEDEPKVNALFGRRTVGPLRIGHFEAILEAVIVAVGQIVDKTVQCLFPDRARGSPAGTEVLGHLAAVRGIIREGGLGRGVGLKDTVAVMGDGRVGTGTSGQAIARLMVGPIGDGLSAQGARFGTRQ